MFCGKCGVRNADDAIFCTKCGTKLNGGTPKKVSSSDQNRKIGMIVVTMTAVAAIALIIFLFGGRSYKATVDKFFEAQFAADAEALFELLPEKVVSYALEEEGYDDDELDEMIEELDEELQDELDYIERYLGEGWTVSYEIMTVEDVSGDDFDDLKDEYEDLDVKVSAAKTVEIEMTIVAGETETSNSMDVSIIKVGRSWYLDAVSMGGFF